MLPSDHIAMPASILDEWFRTRPDERGLREKLTISGLSSAIKAVKRAVLSQKLSIVVDVRVETELRIGRTGRNLGCTL
jgi:hypothetical protein